MPPTENPDPRIRLMVFEQCLRTGTPPPVEELMGRLQLSRAEVESSLDRLDEARHLKLVPGTHRILMAFPFSAIPTPYRVIRSDGRAYFANCAWDALAFYPMLREPIRVESYCYHCGEPVSIVVREGHADSPGRPLPVVYLGLPAAEWWKDIVRTCANTMLFFRTPEHLRLWKASQPDARGVELALDIMLRLSEPLYSGKLELGFRRPSRERMLDLFRELGLSGDFWAI